MSSGKRKLPANDFNSLFGAPINLKNQKNKNSKIEKSKKSKSDKNPERNENKENLKKEILKIYFIPI